MIKEITKLLSTLSEYRDVNWNDGRCCGPPAVAVYVSCFAFSYVKVFFPYTQQKLFFRPVFSFSSTEKLTSVMVVALNYKKSHYFSKTGKRDPTHYALKGLWCYKNPFWHTQSIMGI